MPVVPPCPNQVKYKVDRVVYGTPGFMPPECIAKKGYSDKSDVFSIGSILFSLLTNQNLFLGKDRYETIEMNRVCSLDELDKRMSNFSDKVIEVCRLMLTKDPSKRPNAS